MEEVIAKIIEIEERAREIVKDAKSTKAGLDEELAKETEEMRRDIAQRAERKNVTLREYEDTEAQKKIEQINAKTQELKDALEAKYRENKDKWVTQIVDSVIK